MDKPLDNVSIIVLAAGKGTRMKSDTPKILHEILDKPIIYYILSELSELKPKNIIAVIGNKAEMVKDYLSSEFKEVSMVHQEKQLGTAHAVRTVTESFKDLGEKVVVVTGDIPLIHADTIKGFILSGIEKNSKASVLTIELEDPFGYGRVIKNMDDEIIKIVEEADASIVEKKVNEVNTSIYLFDREALLQNIQEIDSDNLQNEFYLTDIIENLVEKKLKVTSFRADDCSVFMGINDRLQLYKAENIMQARINKEHMKNGVTIRNPESCRIGREVVIENDVLLEQGCTISGNSYIESGCRIGPFSQLNNARVGKGTTINSSIILDSDIGEENNIGPYSYIRPGTKTGSNVKIGGFCEIKKSLIKDTSKVPHLSYIGDTEIGEGVNIGASSVTCNYDGFGKHKTIIEDDVFIGSDTMLIAPVRIGKGAIVAAGSVIYEDVESNSLAIERSKQKNIENGAVIYKHKKNKRL